MNLDRRAITESWLVHAAGEYDDPITAIAKARATNSMGLITVPVFTTAAMGIAGVGGVIRNSDGHRAAAVAGTMAMAMGGWRWWAGGRLRRLRRADGRSRRGPSPA